MICYNELKEALDILRKAKCNLDYNDYINMWGKQLGEHIWFQEGSDLLRIWKSGLTHEQEDSFITYILDKFQNHNLNKRKE